VARTCGDWRKRRRRRRWTRRRPRGCWAPLGDIAAAVAVAVAAAAVAVAVEHRVELWAWQWRRRWLMQRLMAGVFGIWCGRSRC